MKKYLSILPRWIPALLTMVVIFLFSSRTGTELPNFLSWDYAVKKASHAIGYGLLAASFFFALRFAPRYRWLAWLLAILYSATDEFHQSFVPGRHASFVDIFVFDNFGALIALWLSSTLIRKAD
jgi:hypothetical protein